MPDLSRLVAVRGFRDIANAVFTSAADALAVNGLGLIALVLAIVDADLAAIVVAFVAAAAVVFFGARYVVTIPFRDVIAPVGTYLPARVMIVLAVAFAGPMSAIGPAVWIGALVLAAATLVEGSVAALSRAAIPLSVNLPGVSVRVGSRVPVVILFALNTVAVIVAAIARIVGDGGWTLIIAGAIVIVVAFILAVDALDRIRTRQRGERKLNAAIAAYAPAFAVHWDAPLGTAYQVTMWLPYLERLGHPFFIVVRTKDTFAQMAASTTRPVVLRKALEEMDSIVVPSIRTFFYVNTATKNQHLVRYTDKHHIQLNHGDSDKAPSYNPAFRMYDRNFVAGQAAIDRFARNGVEVARSAFEIVGRPQVDGIAVDSSPIASKGAKTVLYAPTWAGFYQDANYSSLPMGVAIVEGLIARGARVIFRTHPYTTRSPRLVQQREKIWSILERDAAASGRDHLWGPSAETERSIVDCFNQSDALVSDISSVVPDYLYSEKPFAIADMQSKPGNEDSFFEESPISRAGYVLRPKSPDIGIRLDELLGADPLASERSEMKRYYLGDFPAESYADAFVETARKYL